MELPQALDAGGHPSPEARFLDPAIVASLYVRLNDRSWQDESGPLDDKTRLALKSGDWLVDAARQITDGVAANLLNYAAIDGLLANRADSDSQTIRRVAHLLGSSPASRKRIRARVQRMYQVRGELGHGRRPHLTELAQAVGAESPPDETSAAFRNPTLEIELSWLSLRVATAVVSTLLLTCIAADPARPGSVLFRPGIWTLAELQATLHQAAQGDAAAQARIDASVPAALRDPF